MQQFLRKVKLHMRGADKQLYVNNGDSGVDLRVDFSISKSISSEQNTSTITVYNLTEGHRNAVGREFDDITLYAGYMPNAEESNVGVIFTGQVRDVRHMRDGKDILSVISLGDGDKALRKSVISKSYPAGTSYQTIVNDLAATYENNGVSRGQWGVDLTAKTTRPVTLYGSSKRELNTIGRTNKFYWSIQNGALELVGNKSNLHGVAVLSEQTGLIGVPVITDKGIDVKALINPAVRPNRQIKVISETLKLNDADNLYRVAKIDYNGSNRGQDFLMSITGEKLS